jgi:hypothetical protein
MMTAAIVLIAICGLAVSRVGGAAVDRARADAAADAAALAAADMLALGRSSEEAVRVAREVASENGAVLLACACRDASAVVTVARGAAQARARAVVDP